MAPDRIVADATTLDLESRLTFTWRTSPGGTYLASQASATRSVSPARRVVPARVSAIIAIATVTSKLSELVTQKTR